MTWRSPVKITIVTPKISLSLLCKQKTYTQLGGYHHHLPHTVTHPGMSRRSYTHAPYRRGGGRGPLRDRNESADSGYHRWESPASSNQNPQNLWGRGDWSGTEPGVPWKSGATTTAQLGMSTDPDEGQQPQPALERGQEEPIQWNRGIFQSTVGQVTPSDLRARRGAAPSSPRERTEERGPRRAERRQRSPVTSDLITRVHAAGITIGVEYDDELNREAHMVIKDLLFKLSQRTDEVSHLEKKVEGLRQETMTRKRADSDEQDWRPSKRREPSRGVTPPHTILKTEGFPASNHLPSCRV